MILRKLKAYGIVMNNEIPVSTQFVTTGSSKKYMGNWKSIPQTGCAQYNSGRVCSTSFSRIYIKFDVHFSVSRVVIYVDAVIIVEHV